MQERLLQPLGMARTTLAPVEPSARGYFVEPYVDVARREPPLPLRGMAPAAQLWSTTADLTRWADFLADPDPAVLEPDTLAEMRHPQVIADLEAWTLAWGLGLMLYRKGERVFHGHAGGMPGFLSERDGLCQGRGTRRRGGPRQLDRGHRCRGPGRRPAHRRAGRPNRAAAVAAVGPAARGGRRAARPLVVGGQRVRLHMAPGAPGGSGRHGRGAERPRPHAVFEQTGPDHWTTVSGREEGEELRAVRAGDGSVHRLYWATYPMTRPPEVFGTRP